MSFQTRCCAAFTLVVALLPAFTVTAAGPTIMVMQPRALASIPGTQSTAVYLTLHNVGGTTERLLRVTSPLAAGVDIHSMVLKDGVMQMRPLDGIDVPAGGMVEFGSGGTHLMLSGLAQPLNAGMVLPLTLYFRQSGQVTIKVPVVALARGATPDLSHALH
jgi:copper(I)-binding protein